MDAPSRVPDVIRKDNRRLGPALAASVLLAAAAWPFLLLDAREEEALAPGESFASPLVLDLDGKGFGTAASEVVFDIDGDGRPDRLKDIRDGLGILVIDSNQDGVRGQSGKELLGTASDIDGDGTPDGRADGFEALAALAHEALHRGWITEASVRAGLLGPVELKALEAGFGLRVRLGGLRGRDVTLKEAGVAGLRIATEPSRRHALADGADSELSERDGAVFMRADGPAAQTLGSAAPFADLWLRYRSALAAPVTAKR